MAKRVNGFGEYDQVIMDDAPPYTMYGDEAAEDFQTTGASVANVPGNVETLKVRGKSQNV